MIVITVGKTYIDIDGYASAIAYRELLKLQGIESRFVSNAVLNYSITPSLLNLPYTVDSYEVNNSDKFIILDLSNKEFFPDFVREDNITEIIDHHPGYEEYWESRLGSNSIIESVGSVATIIFEKYEELGYKVDIDIAKLLMAAILDNTLNFTAKITTERDKKAYNKLSKITNCYNYSEIYFSECQSIIESNLEESIKNDIKIQKVNEYLPEVFGQLTIYNIEKISIDKIKEIMNSFGSKWIINIISLAYNTSYILCSDNDIKEKVNMVFNVDSANNTLIIKPAKLRKEIIKAALSK